MTIQFGDVFRAYVKTIPSIDGDYQGIVLRKKGVNRRSEFVIQMNKKFEEVAKACRTELINAGKYTEKIVYRNGKKVKEKIVDGREYKKCMREKLSGVSLTPAAF